MQRSAVNQRNLQCPGTVSRLRERIICCIVAIIKKENNNEVGKISHFVIKLSMCARFGRSPPLSCRIDEKEKFVAI